mmetsp:Transcript_14289/g.19891  ORF Transcript_14289/g.19891 Transcript_14289/m.19891 type:complete len:499 (-) Transcript_14289:2515-4011(-)
MITSLPKPLFCANMMNEIIINNLFEKQIVEKNTRKYFLCDKKEYNYRLKSFTECETIPHQLNKDVLKSISLKNLEPSWIIRFRFDALKSFYKMKTPKWSDCIYDDIDHKRSIYYSAVLGHNKKISNDLSGLSLDKDKTVKKTAVDLVMDSISIDTTYQKELSKSGVIFTNVSNSLKNFPDLLSSYIGSIVSFRDNYYASLNSAVFSEGSFVYVPKNINCPLDLSTYFRINGSVIGQFERTLIITEENSKVSYLEGCTAPYFTEYQLHAAVVELFASKNSFIKYSTVQNWYPGDSKGTGGIYNFVTKRGLCHGRESRISWTQVETGSSLTWKYPSVILNGENSIGEFYSIALTKLMQQADTGSKMIHIGKKTFSKIISKGISLGNSKNCYRGLVFIHKSSLKSKNATQCDSIIFGNSSSANTYPYVILKDSSAWLEHEASIAKVQDDQIFYLQQRGLGFEEAINLILGGFCKEVIEELPFEFLSEVNELLNSSMIKKIG